MLGRKSSVADIVSVFVVVSVESVEAGVDGGANVVIGATVRVCDVVVMAVTLMSSCRRDRVMD